MNKIKELFEKYKEIISYLFWGGCTTVVSWGSFSLFQICFRGWINNTDTLVVVSNVLSWVCAVLFAYITNKIWVFNSRSWSAKVVLPEVTKFVSARLLTGIMEMFLVPFLVYLGMNQAIFGIEGAVSKNVVSILVILLNYIFSKLFIFKRENKGE